MAFYHLNTLGDSNDPDLCILTGFIEGIEAKSYCAQLGERLKPSYPKDARMFMDPDRPGIMLLSLVGATGGKLIVHTEFKELIEKHCKGVDIEYLPFTLYDHRKRIHSRDYFIINPIGTFDCLDFKASNIVWGKKNPTEVISIRKHVLDRKKMKNAPQLFRIDKDPTEYVIGGDLASDMYDRDLTNIDWTELEFSDEKK